MTTLEAVICHATDDHADLKSTVCYEAVRQADAVRAAIASGDLKLEDLLIPRRGTPTGTDAEKLEETARRAQMLSLMGEACDRLVTTL